MPIGRAHQQGRADLGQVALGRGITGCIAHEGVPAVVREHAGGQPPVAGEAKIEGAQRQAPSRGREGPEPRITTGGGEELGDASSGGRGAKARRRGITIPLERAPGDPRL
jgi:uncharacterized membrane protein YgcG